MSTDDTLNEILTGLLDHLIDEEAGLARMESALEAERDALRGLDEAALQSSLFAKKKAAGDQQGLEAQRERLLSEASSALLGEPTPTPLGDLIDVVQEPWVSQLREIRHQLIRRLSRVQHLHEANRALAISGQRSVSRALEHLSRKASGGTYSPKGRMQGIRARRSVTQG